MIEKKRLAVDLPKTLHNKIKERAHLRNVTITKWILRAIMESLNKELKYE